MQIIMLILNPCVTQAAYSYRHIYVYIVTILHSNMFSGNEYH